MLLLKKLPLLACGMTALLLLSGCRTGKEGAVIGKLDDLNRAPVVIASEVGTNAEKLVAKKFPKARRKGYRTGAEMLAALQSGKIDAFAFDRPALEYMAAGCPQVMILPEPLGMGKISVAITPRRKDLLAPVNQFILSSRENGTLQAMFERWLKTVHPDHPEIAPAASPEGNLRIGLEKEYVPFCFSGPGGRPMGYDVEFAERLALALNLRCEFRICEYEDLFPALENGSIDIAVSQIDATAERQKKMLFSEPYIDSSIGVMIRSCDYAGPASFSHKSIPAEKISRD